MTISVLMAVYNREDTIEDAILSIVTQLTSEDELIISDDSSTDGTLDICTRLAKQYPVIKIFHHDRCGIDENMFFLFNLASKDICIINDSDDISLNNRISVIKELFLTHPNCNCIYHNAKIIDEAGNITNDNFFIKFQQKNNFFNMMLHSTFFGACMAFRTSFAKQVIAKVRGKYNLAWDKSLGFLSKRSNSLLFLPSERLLLYRRWSDNASKSNRKLIDKIKEKLTVMKLYFFSKKIR